MRVPARTAPRLLWLFALALVPALLIGPSLVAGRVFLPQVPSALEPYRSEDPARAERAREGMNYVEADRLFPVLSDQIAMRRALARGELPLWEPALGLGVPLFAESIAGAAWPPNWLAFLIPPEHAAGPLAALSLVLAGLGAWLFLGRIGLARPARLLGALAYQLGGFGVANLFYYMKVDAALAFPWALWAVEGILARKRWSGLAVACALGASLVSGMPTIAVFVGALTGLYAVLRARELGTAELPAALGRTALFLALGLGAGALALLPTLEASRASDRQAVAAAEIGASALPVETLAGVVLPDLVGTPTEPTPSGALPVAWWLTPKSRATSAEHANQLEWNTYAGCTVAALALVALVARSRRALVPFALLALVLGFAQAWPLVRWLHHLPGFNVGAPGRALALAWFLWPWLAALGFDAWLARAPRAVPTLFAAAFAALAVGFFGARAIEPEAWAHDLEATLVERYDEAASIADVRARIPFETSLAAGERLDRTLGNLCAVGGALLAATLAGILASAARWRGLERGLVALPLVAVLLAEGLLAARGHVTGRDPEAGLFPPSDGIDAIVRAAGDGRVVRYDPSESGIADVENLARPNMLQVFGIGDLAPWIVFPPRTFNELFAAIDPRSRRAQGVSRISRPDLVGHPVLDLLRVTAVLSREPLANPRLTPVLERPGLCVYRRAGILGPARVVGESLVARSDEETLGMLSTGAVDLERATVLAPEARDVGLGLAILVSESPPTARGRVASYRRPASGRIELDVEAPADAWLVLHEQHYPGWRAEVNGKPAPIVRADHVYQAVRVSAGTSTVVFRYAPGSFRWGLGITLASLAAAFVLSRRTEGRPATAGRAA
jgi:hypothetical protein